MSSEIAIKATQLSKHYHIYDRPHHRLLQMLFRGRRHFHKTFQALEDISFEVLRGETVGIIGRNGAGKSTLLQLLCGTLTPSSGNVAIEGRVAALLELGAGFNPEFTGRDNVYLNASILGLTHEQIDSRYEAITAFADIGEFIDQPVKTYSSGMYVRLAFAVIAHVDADVLIIDEALAVGDALFTQKCMRFLREFCKNGTLLFVSHDSASVTSLCERAIWLERGRLRAIGPARDICKDYNAEIYKQDRVAARAPGEGKRGAPITPVLKKPIQSIDYEPIIVDDKRWELLKDSPLKNAMQVQAFNPVESFGTGQMTVQDIWLEQADGKETRSITGGELVELVVQYTSDIDIASVIVGFQLKDRRGQILFGDNTCVSTLGEPVAIKAGDTQQGRFRFQMPLLQSGEYSVTVSVAEGTQNDHVQHHWVHDALILQSLCASVSTGIVGIPMIDIRIKPLAAKSGA
ncbi:ABC transporter ATP-binding protein [Alcaligenaceae bacterium]|nr:ABC transporter ATP-binding protein [Alcaligenaceae bacterium]